MGEQKKQENNETSDTPKHPVKSFIGNRKMPGKKKGKKSKSGGKKRKSAKKSAEEVVSDPVVPEYVKPPPPPRDQLVKILTTHKVDDKELFGMKITTRALEKLTPQEIRDLRVVFDTFDITGRGYIGPVEVRRALRGLGFKVNRDQARQMVQDASVKGKSVIDFNEFLDVIIDQQGDDRDIYDEIYQGFKMFDYDNQGKISLENLTQACIEAGVKLNNQELEEMLQEADNDGDGFIDKDEFVKIMLQTNLF